MSLKKNWYELIRTKNELIFIWLTFLNVKCLDYIICIENIEILTLLRFTLPYQTTKTFCLVSFITTLHLIFFKKKRNPEHFIVSDLIIFMTVKPEFKTEAHAAPT